MKLAKFLVVVVVLIARTCRAKIVIPTPSAHEAETNLANGAINILTSCYGDRLNSVALVGKLPDTLFRTLASQHSIPVALIDNTARITDVLTVFPRYRHRLHVFIVGASSSQQLVNLVQTHLLWTIWWNHMGSFIILDPSAKCNNYVPFLAIIWQLNVLNSKYMCFHKKRGIMIYTYNPYTRQAPAPWRPFYVFPAINDHPFTIFSRDYQENEDICVNLDFDKTMDLGRYEVHLLVRARQESVHLKHRKSSAETWTTYDRMLTTIFDTMNANATETVRNISDNWKGDDDMQIPGAWMLHSYDTRLLTYPHEQVGVVLASQFRGHKSQLNKILCVIDFNSRLGLGIVYLTTLAFFKFFVGQALNSAILNLVRITCNTGFMHVPDNTATRIYVACLLFFAVTMQGIYQGNLAALLTTQIPLQNVDTLQDLVDLDYRVYGRRSWRILFQDPELDKRFVDIVKAGFCITYVMNDVSAACVALAPGAILDQAREYGLHVSIEYIIPIYIVFPIRVNLPIEERINKIIAKMIEADAVKPWPARFSETQLSDFQYDPAVMNNKEFKNIELKEVIFAFIILSIGLVCSTIAFIGELVIHRLHTRALTVRVEILN